MFCYGDLIASVAMQKQRVERSEFVQPFRIVACQSKLVKPRTGCSGMMHGRSQRQSSMGHIFGESGSIKMSMNPGFSLHRGSGGGRDTRRTRSWLRPAPAGAVEHGPEAAVSGFKQT